MSLATRIGQRAAEQAQPKSKCSIAKIYSTGRLPNGTTITEEDKQGLREALLDPYIPTRAIGDEIGISLQTIRRHRRRECVCPPDTATGGPQ